MAKKAAQAEEVIEEEVQPQETPQEEPQEQPEIPVQEETKKEEVDFDALKEEMRRDYEEKLKSQQEEMAKKMSQVFGLAEESDDDEKPVYNEGENLTEYLDKYDSWKNRQEEKRTKEQQEYEKVQQEQIQEQQKKQLQTVAGLWNKQANELIKEGLMPEIKDENDQNDTGMKARQELFGAMLEENRKRAEKGEEQTYNLHEVYHRYYKGGKVAGSDIQALGGSPKASSGKGSGYSYEDLHSKSTQELLSHRE